MTQLLSKDISKRNRIPSGQMRRREDNSLPHIERAADTNAEALKLSVRGKHAERMGNKTVNHRLITYR